MKGRTELGEVGRSLKDPIIFQSCYYGSKSTYRSCFFSSFSATARCAFHSSTETKRFAFESMAVAKLTSEAALSSGQGIRNGKKQRWSEEDGKDSR